MKRLSRMTLAAVVGLPIALALAIAVESDRRINGARDAFLAESRAKIRLDARPVEAGLTHIYENLRTIAALPGVRAVDRHGENLVGDPRETLQQIYNNLASAVAVSEVYILPAGFDPDRIDPVTGKPEEPIIMFDELIVDAAARAGIGRQTGMTSAEHEEIEIHEYREFARQIAWYAARFPTRERIEGMSVPMIGSPSLITCDNTYFIHTLNDADRRGILLSVPFYRPDGVFGGVVAGIILDRALTSLIDPQRMALVNDTYGFLVGVPRDRHLDASLAFSQRIELAIPDPRGRWQVWAGRSVAELERMPDMVAAKSFRMVGHALCLVLLAIGLAMWRVWDRRIAENEQSQALLEARVRERTAEIARLASTCPLTGLQNRAEMTRFLEGLAAAGPVSRYGLICMDLDGFKQINDRYGHDAGDYYLKALAARMAGLGHPDLRLARWGGDEFIGYVGEIDGDDAVMALAEALVAAVGQPLYVQGYRLQPRLSVGVAFGPQDGEDPFKVMARADLALYRAKADPNRDVVRYTPSLESEREARRELEAELREAIAAGDFCLHYQPVVDMTDRRLLGFEALIRWQHPRRGTIAPASFITLAEETGLIVEIGRWVLNKALEEAAGWPAHLWIAVNLSPLQTRQPTLGMEVAAALGRSGVAPARLELEVTETVLMVDDQETRRNLESIRGLGARVALDDFGTGYSSLSYLQSFPVDRVKIDRSFVREIEDRPASQAIVRSVLDLAAALGMETTVEGVETEGQRVLLAERGCRAAQGFLFGRPMTSEAVRALLADDDRAADIAVVVND